MKVHSLLSSLLLLQAPAASAKVAPAPHGNIDSSKALREHKYLVQIRAELIASKLQCLDSEKLWATLDCEAHESSEQALCSSVKFRLQQRRCSTSKQKPKPVDVEKESRAVSPADHKEKPKVLRPPAPIAAEAMECFRKLDEEVKARRGRGEQPDELRALEDELGWLAISTLHELPPGSKDTVTIGKRLAVLWPDMETRETAEAILRLLQDGKITLADLDSSLDLFLRACAQPPDGSTSQVCRDLARQLDKRKIESLARILGQIKASYENIERTGKAAQKELESRGGQIDELDAARAFFELSDYIVALEAKASAKASSSIPSAPSAPFLMLVQSAPASKQRLHCTGGDPEEAYANFFRKKLESAGLGVQDLVPVRPEDADRVRTDLPQLVQIGHRGEDGAEWPLCGAYRSLCGSPYNGVFWLRFDQSATGGSLRVSGEWWARGAVRPFKGGSAAASLDSCDFFLIGMDARRVASSALAQLPDHAVPPGRADLSAKRPSRPSPWLAATFAGAPFLADERASTTSKLVPSVLDGLLLTGAAVAAGASVRNRNAFAAGEIHSLAPADHATQISIGCVGLLVLTRVASGLIYEQWWRDSQ